MDIIWDHFRQQAQACRTMGSPFTARLADLAPNVIDRSTHTGRRVLDWRGNPVADAVSLRLFGALHRLVLSDVAPALKAVYPPHEVSDATLLAALRHTLAEHDTFISATLDSAPQTNEVARSAMLLPGFLWLARRFNMPLDVIELGASAGNNLFWDHYAYCYGTAEWGAPNAPLMLEPEVRGKAVPLEGTVTVLRRRACDLNPLDPSSPDDVLRLQSYIWADQTHRMERLSAALAHAAQKPERVVARDAAEFTRACLMEAPLAGALRVIVHTVFWQYLPEGIKADIEANLAASAARAPLAWLRLEADGQSPGAGLHVTLLPSGEHHLLARGDYHGRWIEWLA